MVKIISTKVKSLTLIEVLVAIWILGVTLVAIVGININNLKFARSIDEQTQAIFIALNQSSEGYIMKKYNVDIPRTEISQNFRVEFNVFDLQSIPLISALLSEIKFPAIPLITVYTPSEKKVEVFGKPNP